MNLGFGRVRAGGTQETISRVMFPVTLVMLSLRFSMELGWSYGTLALRNGMRGKTLLSRGRSNSQQERKGGSVWNCRSQGEHTVAAEGGRKVQRASYMLCSDEVIDDLDKPFQRSRGEKKGSPFVLLRREWKLKTRLNAMA